MFADYRYRVWCVLVLWLFCICSTVYCQAPVFDADPCVEDVNVQPDANKNEARAFWTFPTATDVSGNPAAVSCAPTNGDIFNGGTTPVTCTATDTTTPGQTTTCSFDVKVYPTFNVGCPSNTDNIIETAGPVNFITPTAVDSSGATPTVTCAPASGDNFTEPATDVTCTATDTVLTDQEASCTFVVSVGTVPTFETPGSCEDPKIFNVQPDAGINTASSIGWAAPVLSADSTLSCEPDPDTAVFEGGETLVTCTATDDTTPTLISTCEFTVRVYPTLETACPDNIILEADGPGTFTPPTANVDSGGLTAPAVTCDPASGTDFSGPSTDVTCEATDSVLGSQEVSCTFEVIVGAKPVFDAEGSCGAPSNLDVPPDDGRTTASSITWTEPTATDATVTCVPDPDSTTFQGGETPVACKAVNVVDTNLIETCGFNVRVFPAFENKCPEDIIRQPDAGGIYAKVAWLHPTAVDKSGVAATVTCLPESGSSFTGVETDVSCSASDGTDDSTCSFKVGVRPHFETGCPDDIVEPPDSSPPTPVDFVIPTAPSEFPVECSHATGDEFKDGVTTVTCTATDSVSKLEATCSFKVTVGVEPTFNQNCPENILVAADSNGEKVVSWEPATGNADSTGEPAVVTCNYESGSTFNQTETEVLCVATDAGNFLQAKCSFTVTLDSMGPTFQTGCPADESVPASADSNVATHTWVAPDVDDDYTATDDIKVSCIPASGSSFVFGSTTVTCVAIDSVGNTGVCDFTVDVTGTPCDPACTANSMCILSDKGVPECICDEGYTMSENQCANKDECELDKPCHAEATCLDLDPPDMFNCSCKASYFGDGVYTCKNLEKRFNVELAIADSSVGSCDPDVDTESIECIALVTTFKIQAKPLYQQVSIGSFIRIDVNQTSIRKGSVIIPHEVIYDYSKADIRGVTANEFYSRSVKAAVESGMIGSFAVVINCTACQDPEDYTDVCAAAAPCVEGYTMSNDTSMKGKCIPKCVSVCNSGYCNGGECIHEFEKSPVCRNCPSGTTGETCQPVEEGPDLPLIIGLSVGLGVPALLILIGIIAYCVHSNSKKSKVNMSEDSGQANDAMAMENAGVAN